MKRIITTLLAFALITGSAFASAELVKQRAKQQRDINNQQQGVTPPPPSSPPPSAPSPTSTTSRNGLSPDQQALVDRVQTDFASIKPVTTASTGSRLHLVDDLASLDKSAYKPSKTTLTKLSEHLTAALAEKPVSYSNLGKVARDINVILNSVNLTMTQSERFVSDVQLTLKNSGVSSTTVQLVVNDLGSCIVEIQRSKPKLFQ